MKMFTVTLDAIWNSTKDAENLRQEWKKKYNVNAKYTQYTYIGTWSLEGKIEDVKTCIVEEWQCDFADIMHDEEVLKALMRA